MLSAICTFSGIIADWCRLADLHQSAQFFLKKIKKKLPAALLVADERTLVTLLKKELPPLPHSALAPALDGRMPKPAAVTALLLRLLY